MNAFFSLHCNSWLTEFVNTEHGTVKLCALLEHCQEETVIIFLFHIPLQLFPGVDSHSYIVVFQAGQLLL